MLTVSRRVPVVLRLLLPCFMLLLLSITVSAQPVHAASSYSCDEAGLDAALAAGGSATFTCITATTIHTTALKTVTTSVSLDGGDLLTLSGDDAHGLFSVNTGSVTLTLQHIALTHGSVTGAAGSTGAGGAIAVTAGGVVIAHSTFSNNSATGGDALPSSGDGGTAEGGAVFVGPFGHLTITDSTFSDNSATGGHANPQNSQSKPGQATGGALYTYATDARIDNCTFTQNTAEYGGAILNKGTLTLTGSTFTGNNATTAGGAFFNPSPGDFDFPSQFTARNVTFADNHVTGIVGGINGGGAIAFASFDSFFPSNPDIILDTLENVTFSGNAADNGGAIYLQSNLVNVIVYIRNTIIANSVVGQNCAGALYLYNPASLQWPGDSCGSQIPTADPQLGALADNGGATQTFLPTVDSPAVDSGDDDACYDNGNGLTDQRGVARILGGHCDIGAVEQQHTAYFEYSLPTTTTAGDTLTVQVTAKDSANQTLTNYGGTVHFVSTDPNAAVPPDYTFSPADHGTHSFSLTFKTSGTRNLNLYDLHNLALSTSRYLRIVAAPLVALNVSTDADGYNRGTTFTVGADFTFFVYAVDAYNNPVPDYQHTIHLTSSDAAATVPQNTGSGVGRYYMQFATVGTQTLTATDIANPALTNTLTFHIRPAVAQLQIDVPATVVAGQPFAYTVTALDANRNIADSFASDIDGGISANSNRYLYSTDDKGSHVFVDVANTIGQQTIFATTPYTTPTVHNSVTTQVVSGNATVLALTHYPADHVVGEFFPITVEAHDSLGNLKPEYRGTIHFSSTVTGEALPADYTFTAADAGSHTFHIAFSQYSVHYLTITDTSGAPALTSQSITGGGGPTSLNSFALAVTPDAGQAGDSTAMTLVAFDPDGRVAKNYKGTVHFSGSNAGVIVPPDYTFTTADAGSHTFSTTFTASGTLRIRVADVVLKQIGVNTSAPGAPTSLVFLKEPAQSFTNHLLNLQPVVAVLDEFGVVASDYTGTVSLSLNGAGTLNGSTTIAVQNGMATFTDLRIDTANAAATLTATSGTLTGATSQPFVVEDDDAAKLVFTAQPQSSLANHLLSPQPVVTVLDKLGMVARAYTGTVSLSLNGTGILNGTTTVAVQNGVATFTDLRITTPNAAATLTATSGALTSATSQPFVVASDAAKLVFTAQPQDGFVNHLLSPQPVVAVLDEFGAVASYYTGTVSLSLNTPGSLLGTTTIAVQNGLATFTDLRITTPNAAATLTATSGTLPSAASQPFMVENDAAKLVFTTQPRDGFANRLLSPQPVVAVLDEFGAVASYYTGTVSLSLNTPGSLLGTTTIAVQNGLASFTDLRIDTANAAATLTATSGAVPGATSQPFVVEGDATKLVITTQPQGGKADALLTQQPVVTVQNAQGQTITDYAGVVHLALVNGQLDGTTSVSVVNGIAVFTNLRVATPGRGYSLTASSSPLTGTTSQAFDILPAGAYIQMALRPQPSNDPKAYSMTVTLTNQTDAPLAAGTAVTFAFDGLRFTPKDRAANTVSDATWQTLTTHKGVAILNDVLAVGASRNLTIHLRLLAPPRIATVKATMKSTDNHVFSSNTLTAATTDGATYSLNVSGAKNGKSGTSVLLTFSATYFAPNELLVVTVTPANTFAQLPTVSTAGGKVVVQTQKGVAAGTYTVHIYGWWSGITATTSITLT